MRIKVALWKCAVLMLSPCALGQQTMNTPSHLSTVLVPIPASYFGMHIHRPAANTWPQAGFGDWRLWDSEGTTWYNLEPQAGHWDFSKLDRDVAMAEQHRVGMLLTLGQSPPWASMRPTDPPTWRPGGPAPPRNEEDWRLYVQTVAARYKGRIRAYEVWNEPNLKMFYTGTREQLVVLARDAFQIIHEVDPTAIVVSPSVTGNYDVPWFSKYLDLGGGKYADVIGYHFYSSPNSPESAVAVIQNVKSTMQAHGIHKPIWNTEAGYLIHSGFKDIQPEHGTMNRLLSQDEALAYVMQSYILNWAAGVSRLYWYDWDGDRMGIADNLGRSRKPAAFGYETIRQWLTGAAIQGCDRDADDNWSCQLLRNGRVEWLVWNSDRTVSKTIPSAWAVQQYVTLGGSGAVLTGCIDSKRTSIYGPTPTLWR